jgi:DNA modification methylase
MPVHLALHVLESLDGTAGAVYEPFCGTGTTIIAAEQLGRSCLAVELVPQYVDVTIKRWQDFTGKRAVLERAGEMLRLSNSGELVPVAGNLENNPGGNQ